MKLDSMAWKLESIYINDDLAETTSQACTGFFKGAEVVYFVMVWGVPRDSGGSDEILGSPQTITKHTTFSTLRRPGGASGRRGARRGLKK